jgi:aquaporin Z
MARKSKKDDVTVGAILAECIGTFSLSFAVLASINGVFGSVIPTAVIAGFTLFLAVLTIGGISGAHINPGITVGLLSLGRISANRAVYYVIAQVVGAFAAAAVVNTLLDGVMATVQSGDADFRIFLAEAIGMIFFGMGVAAATVNQYKGMEAAAVVGGSLFLGVSFALVASNGVLNPAVAFAINSVNVVYLVAPLVGSVVGMNLYTYMVRQNN